MGTAGHISYSPNSFDCVSLTLQSQIPDSENHLPVVLSSFKLENEEKNSILRLLIVVKLSLCITH